MASGAMPTMARPWPSPILGTGKDLGTVPNMGAAETARAIAAADKALPAWRARTAADRAKLMRKLFDLMIAHQDDLGELLSREQGKPLAEAKGEIAYGASFVEWFAEEGKRAYGDVVPSHAADRRIVVLKQAIGVVAAITPWNFPTAMITRKLGPALAAGCTIVIKPASATPYSALALAHLCEEAGIPAGVVNVVTGSARAIGGELTGNPKVRKLTFTGSTEIGIQLMRECAGTVKKVSMELGGNAPFLVFDDADIDAAVEGAVISKFRNAGQTCVCTNRFYVQDGVYDAFVDKLAAKVKALKVGYGMDAGTVVGPLIDEAGVAKVEEHLADALAGGATVLAGGHRSKLGGTFFEPTVVSNVTKDMKLAREETFRAARRGDPLHRRGRGHCHGQRQRVRAGQLLLRARPVARVARGRGAGSGDRGHQHRADLHRSRPVRRDQAIRAWAAKARATGWMTTWN